MKLTEFNFLTAICISTYILLPSSHCNMPERASNNLVWLRREESTAHITGGERIPEVQSVEEVEEGGVEVDGGGHTTLTIQM